MNENSTGKYKKVQCPTCKTNLPLATVLNVDYDLRKAENRVWCYKCGKYIKFSLKQD